MNTNYGPNNGPNLARLEPLRARFGEERAKGVFREAAQKNRQTAAVMVNDENLRFRTLFALMPDIKQQEMYEELVPRNRAALYWTGKILNDNELTANLKEEKDPITEHEALVWMLKSGFADDGKDNAFARVLDGAAALLADRYHDKENLPLMADMLFRRARAGYLVHDLAWALFRANDPQVLRLAANHLRSPQSEEYNLACSLLHLEPNERGANRQWQYNNYMNWLDENYDYLYATDESFQSSNAPNAYAVDTAAQYLCKPTLRRTEAIETAARAEAELPKDFLKLTKEEKQRLALYSNRLKKWNPARWEDFIKQPVERQIGEANSWGEAGV